MGGNRGAGAKLRAARVFKGDDLADSDIAEFCPLLSHPETTVPNATPKKCSQVQVGYGLESILRRPSGLTHRHVRLHAPPSLRKTRLSLVFSVFVLSPLISLGVSLTVLPKTRLQPRSPPHLRSTGLIRLVVLTSQTAARHSTSRMAGRNVLLEAGLLLVDHSFSSVLTPDGALRHCSRQEGGWLRGSVHRTETEITQGFSEQERTCDST